MHLHLATDAELNRYLSRRAGERHQGESWLLGDQLLGDSLTQKLAFAKAQGIRFVLLGIPEDIGPRANLGRGGADGGWDAFLSQFANQQCNELTSGDDILLLGHIDTADLQSRCHQLDASNDAQLQQLRHATAELDARVTPVIEAIAAKGLEAIVIGGGHNNALPILAGYRLGLNQPLAAVNLDPHSDFRATEGRHSGNGFAYAAQAGHLCHYHVLGLNELKNNQHSLDSLTEHGFGWHSLQQLWIRREMSLATALSDINASLNAKQCPVGLELDLDAIAGLASSAETMAGIPLMDAAHIVYALAQSPHCTYLHLAEGAPSCHISGLQAGKRQVGQALSELVFSYLSARRQPLG